MSSSGAQRISVIIPCLNDGSALKRCLANLQQASDRVALELEVVVADASRNDFCAGLAKDAGATVVRCTRPGRGNQLNAGAAAAVGEVLLFNHADTNLSEGHLSAAMDAMRTETTIGGAFYRDLAWQYPGLAWADRWVRLYTRHFGILYGDQSIFVRRCVFDAMGGFADLPIMEDVDFSARLRRQGPIVLMDPPLQTSMRRFRDRGYLRNKLQNMGIVWLWRLNLASPAQIYNWYYGREI